MTGYGIFRNHSLSINSKALKIHVLIGRFLSQTKPRFQCVFKVAQILLERIRLTNGSDRV